MPPCPSLRCKRYLPPNNRTESSFPPGARFTRSTARPAPLWHSSCSRGRPTAAAIFTEAMRVPFHAYGPDTDVPAALDDLRRGNEELPPQTPWWRYPGSFLYSALHCGGRLTPA